MKPTVPDLKGRRCLITGAASGIGRSTAIAASRKGAELFLTDIAAEGLDNVAAEITNAGGKVSRHRAVDVSDHDAVLEMANEIHAAHGSMDVVANVAGISRWGSVSELHHEDWRQLVDINLMGPIHVLEAFVPAMVESGRGGHILNVSSAAGLFGLPWHAAYSAGKFGLRGVSEVLRFDLRRHGIGVSLVCPGAVKTPLVGTVQIRGIDRDSSKVRKLVDRFERHAASPDEVADRMIAAIEKNRYLVFTSTDIRLLWWTQRYFPPAYELIMRKMNDILMRAARSTDA